MQLYCCCCKKYVNAEKFQRIIDLEKKIFEEEVYCPGCLGTIYINKKNT